MFYKDASLAEPFFRKQTTDIIKGVALIMMFVHHMFTIPANWIEGIEYPFIEKVAPYFTQPFKLCVAIFCFITGYFYYFNKNKTFKHSLRKISDIYVDYWVVLLLMWIGYKLLKINVGGIKFVLKELIGLETNTMVYCWYVGFYAIVMISMPLIIRIISSQRYIDFAIVFIIIPVLLSICGGYLYIKDNQMLCKIVFDILDYLPIMLTGYVFADYKLFDKLNMVSKFKYRFAGILLFLLVALIIPMGRYLYPYISFYIRGLMIYHINLDIIYAPIFIFSIVQLEKLINIKILKKVLGKIGEKSLLMWFVSCGFDNKLKIISQQILYYVKNPLFVLIWGLIICYALASIINIPCKKICSIKNKFFRF